jgi:hypothetical protein
MRDSPFPEHKLHIGSYLRGPRGFVIATAAASGTGMRPEQFLGLMDRLPDLEFSMPRPYDRALWTGSADVVVGGMDRSWAELYAADGAAARVTGYTTDGRVLSIAPDEYFAPPLLLIRPAEARFGTDPEAMRRAASRRSGSTISTREEEHGMTTASECDPSDPTLVIECDVERGGNIDWGGYWLSHSYSTCNAAAGYADADQDELRDECELEIAKAFAPMLRFDRGEQHYGRDPYWSVKRDAYRTNSLQIFYLVAYYRDPGDPVAGWAPHDGDSEFLIVSVQDVSGNGRWSLDRMTYSAHWHAGWDRTRENLSYDDVEYVDNFRGRPRSWVSEGKHANYAHRSSCNGNFDDCHNPEVSDNPLTYPPRLDPRNIGNYWAGAGIRLWTQPCATTIYAVPYTECLWTDNYFRGWQTEDGGGAGGYKNSLSWYGF